MIDSIQTGCYIALITLTLLSNFVLIPININLITSATCIIYIGSTLSLKLKHHREATGEKNEDTMTAKDAYMFPVFGSLMLFGLYVLFKFFDKEWVNLLLALYFALIGTYSLTAAFDPVVCHLLFKEKPAVHKFSFSLPYFGKTEFEISQSEILTSIFALIFSGVWLKTKHFLLNNIFGIAFSIKGVEAISIGSYKVGVILLAGLFFYDIFWVFGTDVMVTVATSFDAPIKLLFPREFATVTSKAKFSMLGLGDIVIPGVFIALLLRFDAHRAGITEYGKPFLKTYFHINLLFYVFGLLATVFVMYFFQAAQPALLYLVPACLGSSIGTALYCGEFSELFAYSEGEEESNDKEEKKKENKKSE